jgi:hypothetical protein
MQELTTSGNSADMRTDEILQLEELVALVEGREIGFFLLLRPFPEPH